MVLPTITSTVPIEPVDIKTPDEAVTRMGQTANLFERAFSQDAQRDADAKAISAGTIAGSKQGFKPTSGGGEAQIKFNEAALASNKYTTGAGIYQRSSELYNQSLVTAKNDPQKAKELFNASYTGMAQGIIQNSPEENKPYFKNLLTHNALKYNTNYDAQIQKVIRVKQFVTTNKNLDVYKNEASNAAFAGDKNGATSALSDSKKQTDIAIKAGVLTKKQAKNAFESTQNEYNKQLVLGQYYQALKEDIKNAHSGKATDHAQQFKDNFMRPEKYTSQFSMTDKTNISSNDMQKLNRQMFAQAGMNDESYKQLRNRIMTQSSKGIRPSDQNMALAAEMKPKSIANLKYDSDLSYQAGTIANSVKYSNFRDMKAKVAQLSAPMTQKDLAAPGGADAAAVREQSIKLIQGNIKKMLSDPVTYFADDDVFQKELRNADQTGGQSDIDVMLNRQRAGGLSDDQLRVQPQQQDQQDIAQITPDLDNGLDFLLQKQQEFGKNYPIYMQGLVKNGLDSKYQPLVGAASNPDNRANVPDIMESMKNSEAKVGEKTVNLQREASERKDPGISKDIEARTTSNESNFMQSLRSTNANNDKLAEELHQQDTNLALYYYTNKNMKWKAATDKAFNTLIKNQYSLITPTYRVPFNQDPDRVRTAMKHYESLMKTGKLDFVSYGSENKFIPKGALQAATFRDVIRTGHWANTPNDAHGYMWVDALGNAARFPTGKGFGFTFEQLNDPDFFKHVKGIN